jgi:polar amino acid transport system substrate-binding protein
VTRLLRALLISALALGLGACQSSSGSGAAATSAPTQESRLDGILDSRVLRVGLSGSQPPLNMKDRDGEIIGLEVELMQALADSMALELRLVTMPFADLLPALERGEVDLVISGMTITPDRNARVAFVGPYLISGKSVLSKSYEIANVEDVEKLDLPSRSYAALAGSTSEAFVRKFFPSSKLVATPDYDSALEMVLDDRVDALIADYPFCMLSVLRRPDAGLASLATPFTVEPLGIALPADDILLMNLVGNYLSTLEATGKLTQLKAKWFSEGPWLAELP